MLCMLRSRPPQTRPAAPRRSPAGIAAPGTAGGGKGEYARGANQQRGRRRHCEPTQPPVRRPSVSHKLLAARLPLVQQLRHGARVLAGSATSALLCIASGSEESAGGRAGRRWQRGGRTLPAAPLGAPACQTLLLLWRLLLCGLAPCSAARLQALGAGPGLPAGSLQILKQRLRAAQVRHVCRVSGQSSQGRSRTASVEEEASGRRSAAQRRLGLAATFRWPLAFSRAAPRRPAAARGMPNAIDAIDSIRDRRSSLERPLPCVRAPSLPFARRPAITPSHCMRVSQSASALSHCSSGAEQCLPCCCPGRAMWPQRVQLPHVHPCPLQSMARRPTPAPPCRPLQPRDRPGAARTEMSPR